MNFRFRILLNVSVVPYAQKAADVPRGAFCAAGGVRDLGFAAGCARAGGCASRYAAMPRLFLQPRAFASTVYFGQCLRACCPRCWFCSTACLLPLRCARAAYVVPVFR